MVIISTNRETEVLRDRPQATALQNPPRAFCPALYLCPQTLSSKPDRLHPARQGPVEAIRAWSLRLHSQPWPLEARPPKGHQAGVTSLLCLYPHHPRCLPYPLLLSVFPGTPSPPPSMLYDAVPLLPSGQPWSCLSGVLNPTPPSPSCLGPSGAFWHIPHFQEDNPHPSVLILPTFPEKQSGPRPTWGDGHVHGDRGNPDTQTQDQQKGSCSGQGIYGVQRPHSFPGDSRESSQRCLG